MNDRLIDAAHAGFQPQPDMSLGTIAVSLPGATAVFRQAKLDFCCGGQVSLADAAQARGLALQPLMDALHALRRDTPVPPPPSTPELIDHILARYHEVHRAQLPELVRMARRVEAVHRDHPEVPAGLATLLENMEQELLDHMAKEEQILFPILRAGGSPMVRNPIGVMRNEHTGHGQTLEALQALTNGATPPQGACNTWRALYAGIAQLHDDLIEHIHLENNLLFPAFEPAATGCGTGACQCA